MQNKTSGWDDDSDSSQEPNSTQNAEKSNSDV